MNILRIAGELFLLYLLYKFIFNFIIPIYQASLRIKKQFTEMQDKMQGHQSANNTNNNNNNITSHQTPVSKEDFIEFEEIK